jgi:hypothetical protein
MRTPSLPLPLVGEADYEHDSDEERLTMEFALGESARDREADILREQAEERRALALVEARLAKEAKEEEVPVKEELADLIDLTDE